MITLTEDEVKAVLNTLGEMPFKMSAGVIQFLNKKIEDSKLKQSELHTPKPMKAAELGKGE